MINCQKLVELKEGSDNYMLAAFAVAEKVMEYLESNAGKIVANELIKRADKELRTGITGHQSGLVAYIVLKCHSRGREFARSWNEYWGIEGVDDKVINPAILAI